MENAPGVTIPKNQDQIDEAFVQSSYAIATEYLKHRFKYIFNDAPAGLIANYNISTWSRKIARSEVIKNGTEEDKQKLPPPNKRNRPREEKHTRVSGTHSKPRKVAKRGTARRQYAFGREEV